jgi:hypothetical protein
MRRANGARKETRGATKFLDRATRTGRAESRTARLAPIDCETMRQTGRRRVSRKSTIRQLETKVPQRTPPSTPTATARARPRKAMQCVIAPTTPLTQAPHRRPPSMNAHNCCTFRKLHNHATHGRNGGLASLNQHIHRGALNALSAHLSATTPTDKSHTIMESTLK